MGPLQGITVIEIAGIGPGPFAAMSLADMGADVIRVERPGGGLFAARQDTRLDLLNRGKRCIGIDLKTPEGVDTVLQLAERADALLEGNRPGVMERLGLGPDTCLARNPKLVYGRMTGWGQDGPLAGDVGHDLNYVALSGALHAMGRKGEKPAIPLNLVGDFGGGGLMLAYGMVCALLEARSHPDGQHLRGPPGGLLVRRARHQRAGLRRALLRGLRDGRWQVHQHRPGGATILRRPAGTTR